MGLLTLCVFLVLDAITIYLIISPLLGDKNCFIKLPMMKADRLGSREMLLNVQGPHEQSRARTFVEVLGTMHLKNNKMFPVSVAKV